MGADWTGNIEDKSLYDIWYKMYKKSGLFKEKEKQPNIIIEIQDGLVLEDGWENLVQFEADDAVPADIFEIEPTLESIETAVDVIKGSTEEPDKENIPEKEKSIDEVVEEENCGNRETSMSGKSIEGILQNIEMTPEKRTDNVEGKQSRGELVNEAEIGDSRSNTKHSRVLPGVVIPSPFKNSLFWPEPTKKVIKRNIRVKVPSVGTSDAWREYFLKKEDEQKKINSRKRG
ncbi:uncharacterized protein [Leptinotarsa decemlineata]|uniref:uncharacterized protein n=1 Tax=Leptinotarsa decemlineata TaxID=7539 RepID=UPI003D30A310